MTLIGWLVVLEIVLGIGLLIWYMRRAHKHVKHSPAEIALKEHLAELEADATVRHEHATAKSKPKKAKKS